MLTMKRMRRTDGAEEREMRRDRRTRRDESRHGTGAGVGVGTDIGAGVQRRKQRDGTRPADLVPASAPTVRSPSSPPRTLSLASHEPEE